MNTTPGSMRSGNSGPRKPGPSETPERLKEGRIMTRGVPRWRRLLAAPFFYVGVKILGGQVWLEEFNHEPKQDKRK